MRALCVDLPSGVWLTVLTFSLLWSWREVEAVAVGVSATTEELTRFFCSV